MTMIKTLTRKQRELLQREDLILDTARHLLYTYGYLGLTMDKIAESMEYSKGTIYQHFSCKEEVLTHLCIRSLSLMQELITRAAQFNGCSRERITAVMVAYSLFVFLHPTDFDILQMIKTCSMRDKTSPESQQALLKTEIQVHRSITEIVLDAIAQGDLNLRPDILPEEVVFNLWATAYGTLLILSKDVPLIQMGIPEPYSMLRRMANHFLDSLQWQPLSGEIDGEVLYQRLLENLFAPEVAQLSPEVKQRFLSIFG